MGVSRRRRSGGNGSSGSGGGSWVAGSAVSSGNIYRIGGSS